MDVFDSGQVYFGKYANFPIFFKSALAFYRMALFVLTHPLTASTTSRTTVKGCPSPRNPTKNPSHPQRLQPQGPTTPVHHHTTRHPTPNTTTKPHPPQNPNQSTHKAHTHGKREGGTLTLTHNTHTREMGTPGHSDPPPAKHTTHTLCVVCTVV